MLAANTHARFSWLMSDQRFLNFLFFIFSAFNILGSRGVHGYGECYSECNYIQEW